MTHTKRREKQTAIMTTIWVASDSLYVTQRELAKENDRKRKHYHQKANATRVHFFGIHTSIATDSRNPLFFWYVHFLRCTRASGSSKLLIESETPLLRPVGKVCARSTDWAIRYIWNYNYPCTTSTRTIWPPRLDQNNVGLLNKIYRKRSHSGLASGRQIGARRKQSDYRKERRKDK